MILIERQEERRGLKGKHIVLLFGAGLIGRSILAATSKNALDKINEFSFTWNLEHRQLDELEAIEQHIIASHNKDATLPISRIDIVWAAGNSGFGSPEDHVLPEMKAFGNVLSFSQILLNRIADAQHSFHLISSAGGLFEGQKHVDRDSVPRPLRPYSHAKLQQEQLLSRLSAQTRKMIYRLSSVYGFFGKGTRFGLVNTIIQNSIRRQSSNIYGNLHTIRDYVLVSDIGKFVAGRLQDIDQKSYLFTLASGKPTTIIEMLNRIEKIIGRKFLYTFNSERTNATDMSFSPAILPQFWHPTDLETGLRKTARLLVSSSLAFASPVQSQFNFRI